MPRAIVDAHQHFWDPTTRNDYLWMSDLPPPVAEILRRPYLPSDLEPLLAQHGVQKTVLVQAAATETEGRYLLSLAEQNDFIKGVVVWIDMESQAFSESLDEFCAHPKFVGIRPMLQDLPDPDWMLGDAAQRALALLEEKQVCFDFLIKEPHLPAAIECLRRFPKLCAVIDHCAKPDLRSKNIDRWAGLLREAAQFPNSYCKLSGLVTEASGSLGPASWRRDDLRRAVVVALESFGPERLMFGSDWPVCTLAASYTQVLKTLDILLQEQGLAEAALDAIFSGTASAFYRI